MCNDFMCEHCSDCDDGSKKSAVIKFYTLWDDIDDNGMVTKYDVVRDCSEKLYCIDTLLSFDGISSHGNGTYGIMMYEIPYLIEYYISEWRKLSLKCDANQEEMFTYLQSESMIIEDIETLNSLIISIEEMQRTNFGNIDLKNRMGCIEIVG